MAMSGGKTVTTQVGRGLLESVWYAEVRVSAKYPPVPWAVPHNKESSAQHVNNDKGEKPHNTCIFNGDFSVSLWYNISPVRTGIYLIIRVSDQICIYIRDLSAQYKFHENRNILRHSIFAEWCQILHLLNSPPPQTFKNIIFILLLKKVQKKKLISNVHPCSLLASACA